MWILLVDVLEFRDQELSSLRASLRLYHLWLVGFYGVGGWRDGLRGVIFKGLEKYWRPLRGHFGNRAFPFAELSNV
jgi:hypothetical protein